MTTFIFTLDLEGTAKSAHIYKWIDLDVPFSHEIVHESNSLWEIVSIAMGYFRALYGDTKYDSVEEQGLIECLSSGFNEDGWVGGCLPDDLEFIGAWRIDIVS